MHSWPASRRRGRAAPHLDLEACDRARGRRADAAPRRFAPSSRTRNGGWSPNLPTIPTASWSPLPRGRRDLRRGGARGDLPALGQAARMDRRRARVSGLAQRARSGPPRLAGDAGASKHDALLMGAALTQAQSWLAKRAEDLPAADREFIALSIERETRRRRGRGASGADLRAAGRRHRRTRRLDQSGVHRGAVALVDRDAAHMRRARFGLMCLSAAQEQALKPGDSFKECAQDCPEMIVVPAGSFTMGRRRQAAYDEGRSTRSRLPSRLRCRNTS